MACYHVATIIIIFKIVEVTHHYTSDTVGLIFMACKQTNPYDLYQQWLIICLSHIHVHIFDVHVYNYVVKQIGNCM